MTLSCQYCFCIATEKNPVRIVKSKNPFRKPKCICEECIRDAAKKAREKDDLGRD